MQDLSQQADRRVAQLGLVDSSETDSDHDDVEASACVRAKEKSASNGGAKSFIPSYGRIASLVSRMLAVILNMMS